MRNLPFPFDPPPARWIDPQPVRVDARLLDFVQGKTGLAEALTRRGITTPELARPFLDPAHYLPCAPAELPDLTQTADHIDRAVLRGETILVWGDFDVDGQTATAILVSALRTIGANVRYYIPVRERESHGVQPDRLAALLDAATRVVLTCDTGVSAHDTALIARQHGVDFLITDHHTLPEELPDAAAIVNPQRLDTGHPLRPLSGAGVAYKLAEELLGRRGMLATNLLDLAALGTVADQAPLIAENRYLVQRGLERMQSTDRLALLALCETAEIDPANVSEEHIGFALAPRLNAIGRLGDAAPVVEFLLTSDPTFARVTAAQLDGLNAERKLLCDRVYQSALALIGENTRWLDLPALVLAQPDWHPGVVGIVASRLVEIFARPVVLLVAPPDQPLRGSARSITGVNLIQAIEEQSDLLLAFGGHPMAAGMSLMPENLSAFREGLARSVDAQLAGRPLEPELHIEVYQPITSARLKRIEEYAPLAPFGQGNPPLTFATRNLTLRDSRIIGSTGEHLRLVVADDSGETRTVFWWQGAGQPLPEGRFDLAYSLRSSDYRGQREVQIEWLNARPAVDFIRLDEKPDRPVLLDFRSVVDPTAHLLEWVNAGHALVWAEGGAQLPVETLKRHELTEAESLVVWTPPPNRALLMAAIRTVQPKKVVFFGEQFFDDRPQPFLSRLAGLVRYCLTERKGWVNVTELSAATAQTERAVRLGLAWLAARGHITRVSPESDAMQFVTGGFNRPPDLQRIEKELTILLEETAAFRSYYLRADLANLVESDS